MVATTPALIATPSASHACEAAGGPTCNHAHAASASHAGWLAKVSPNTRWVALSSTPRRSRCNSRPRLPRGYANALATTHSSAIQPCMSSVPRACPNCISSTPTMINTPTPNAARGMRDRASS